jgi:transposase
MKAYSLDLREKVVKRYEAGGVSQRELARQFSVSLFFVEKVLKLSRGGQSLAPRRSGGSPPRKFNSAMCLFVRERLERQNDLTLRELCERVEEQFKVEVSPAVMCRTLARMNLRRKKRLSTPSSATVSE